MSIRKRNSKKAKNGFTYQVYFPYKDSNGITTKYIKSGFITKKEAMIHETKMKEELRVNDGVYEKNLTFNQAYEEYMKIVGERKYALSTKQYYNFYYNKYIKNGIGKREIKYLKYRDLQAYFNNNLITPANAFNIKKVFCVVFKYALKNKYINDNPMLLVTIENKYVPEEKNPLITEKQLYQIINGVLSINRRSAHNDYTRFNNYSYAMALFIGWYLGLRSSEVFGLMKSDFDFENRTVTIQRRLEYHGLKKENLKFIDRLKTDASYATLPLATPLIEGLKKGFEYNPYEYVIVDINGNLLLPAGMHYRIKTVTKKLNIDFRYHALRHNFTSNLVAHGIKPNVVKELVRHSDISTTLGVYTHIKDNELLETIDSVFDKKEEDD